VRNSSRLVRENATAINSTFLQTTHRAFTGIIHISMVVLLCGHGPRQQVGISRKYCPCEKSSLKAIPHRFTCCLTGLIDVQGSFGEEMEAQGVTKKVPFVVTDQYLTPSEDEENTYVVQPFISMQTDTQVVEGSQFIVNGASKPTFDMRPGKLKKS
jgi:hypothetical protein